MRRFYWTAFRQAASGATGTASTVATVVGVVMAAAGYFDPTSDYHAGLLIWLVPVFVFAATLGALFVRTTHSLYAHLERELETLREQLRKRRVTAELPAALNALIVRGNELLQILSGLESPDELVQYEEQIDIWEFHVRKLVKSEFPDHIGWIMSDAGFPSQGSIGGPVGRSPLFLRAERRTERLIDLQKGL